MNLNQIAMDAVDEADKDESAKNAIKRKDNGDGTVTLSLSFELDPKVVAEKAKAMGRGIKRDDLSDDLAFADDVEEESTEDSVKDIVGEKPDREDNDDYDEDEYDDDDPDPYNDVQDTMFSDALDELIDEVETEDAKIGRHGVGPLENCRARDPRFCPYHGVSAWTQQMNEDLKSAGITGATVNVSETEHRTKMADSGTGKYTIDVTCQAGDEAKVAAILQGYYQMRGIKDPTEKPAKVGKTARGTKPATPGIGAVQKAGGAEATFGNWGDKNYTKDKFGLLQEQFDDLMDDSNFDYGNREQVDLMNELSDLLDNQIASLVSEKKDESGASFEPDAHRILNANDQQKLDDLIEKASDKYHVLSAKIQLPKIQMMADVDNAAAQLKPDFDKSVKDLDDAKVLMNNTKLALGWKPDAHGTPKKPTNVDVAGHDSWMSFISHTIQNTSKEMADAEAELAKAKQNNDIDHARVHLKSMLWAASNAKLISQNLDAMEKSYRQGLYDWAKGANVPSLSGVFPSGRPQ